jgi:hypothetical protein
MLPENAYYLANSPPQTPPGNYEYCRQQESKKQDYDKYAVYIQRYSSNRPLVLGSSPEIRWSIAVALSSALPKALNRASALWWSLVP